MSTPIPIWMLLIQFLMLTGEANMQILLRLNYFNLLNRHIIDLLRGRNFTYKWFQEHPFIIVEYCNKLFREVGWSWGYRDNTNDAVLNKMKHGGTFISRVLLVGGRGAFTNLLATIWPLSFYIRSISFYLVYDCGALRLTHFHSVCIISISCSKNIYE